MSRPHRIVSLLPSATEIVCALGFRGALVGRSHECDHPAGVASLPVCTAPRFATGGSSREIDRAVRGLLAGGPSLYRVDEAMLARLVPDLIVTQSQCEVCAVSLDDVEAAVGASLGQGARVVSLSAETLDGVWADIRSVADALGEPARGAELTDRLGARVAAVEARAGGAGERPRVLSVEWLEPLMVAGNWMPELVAHAGGESVLVDPGSQSATIAWEQVVRADPDVIVLMPCGFDIARTREELEVLTARPQWAQLRAVRDGRVVVTDANQYFNRPGPRIAGSVEILAEVLHPALFSPRHEPQAWQRI